MTIKSMAELRAQADATLPDNTTQEISPGDVRAMFKDFLDTVAPAYGVIRMTTLTRTLSPTSVALAPFSESLYADTGYYTTNLSLGAVTRQIASASIAGATDFLIASGSVSGANNANVVVEIWKNGVLTAYSTSVTCSGAGDDQAFNIAGITYTAGVNAQYELRARGPNGSYTFKNVLLVAQAQPVRSFT